jgi:hypothetical protein
LLFFLERICFLAGDSEIRVKEFGSGEDDDLSSIRSKSGSAFGKTWTLVLEEEGVEPTSRRSGSEP